MMLALPEPGRVHGATASDNYSAPELIKISDCVSIRIFLSAMEAVP